MKPIVYLVSSMRRTGPVNIIYDVIKYLDRNAFAPHLITLSEEGPDSRQEDFRALGVTLHKVEMSGLAGLIKGLPRLKALLKHIDPVAVHTTGFRPDVCAALIRGTFKRVSSQLNYPFEDYVMTYGKKVGGTMARLTVWALRRFQVSVACSEDVASKMLAKGIRSEVVYNAIDQERFVPVGPEEKKRLRAGLGIAADAEVFIFVGVLTDRKQPLVTIDAFRQYREQHKNAVLLVLGNGDLADECRRRAGNEASVMFAGNVADTRDYLNASDIYIATSKAEGMPVSVLEAMALKLPVLLSEIKPHQEILAFDELAGFLVPVGSAPATLQHMEYMHQADKADKGARALGIIGQHLNARLMSRKYQLFY